MRTSSNAEQAPRLIAIDYLRTTLTLMVVAHHSALAYTTFAFFNADQYLASTAPVVDEARWLVFDVAQNFNDVFFMSLMFFVSGLFVIPALKSHGPINFVRGRLWRLGAPFVLGVFSLIPLALYASWQLTDYDHGFIDYWLNHYLFTKGWVPGPLWFIWLLLLFNVIAVAIYTLLTFYSRSTADFVEKIGQALQHLPSYKLALLITATVGVAYIGMLANFGNGWSALGFAPLYFQNSRILLYFAWFSFGVVIGAPHIKPIFRKEGVFAKSYLRWAFCMALAYIALLMWPLVSSNLTYISPMMTGLGDAILWVISCVCSCFAFLAFYCAKISSGGNWLNHLNRHAYCIYVVHYIYVLWLQRVLMAVELHAAAKFGIVFIGAVVLSWFSSVIVLRIPYASRIL